MGIISGAFLCVSSNHRLCAHTSLFASYTIICVSIKYFYYSCRVWFCPICAKCQTKKKKKIRTFYCLYFLSVLNINALGEIFPFVQAVVQGILLGCSPCHLPAGEASCPVSLRVHCDHPTQPSRSELHAGQA